MRHKPAFAYKGLTVVLSNPSRNDHRELLSGIAGYKFTDLLRPHLNRYQLDIRTSDTIGEGLLPNTKCLLLLGEKAMKEWTGGRYNNYSIHEQRGCPLVNDWRLPCITTYFPQDTIDIQDYEGRLNPLSEHHENEDEDDAPDDDYEGQKRKGKTARSNWGFWFEKDIGKVVSLYLSGWTQPESPFVQYHIRPNLDEVIQLLYETKGKQIYLDIETDSLLQIRCIGFSFGLPNIYVVPLFNYNYNLCYNRLAKFFAALTVAFNNNQIVIHNSAFDLFVLVWRYGIPVGSNIFDTMLAWHRCYPEVEKSLGHCVSALTWEPYHKDEICYNPLNDHQDLQLWKYNGKDIYTMILVKKGIDELARNDEGLQSSINQVNDSIRPYLINTIYGIKFSQENIDKQCFKNDRKMEQLLRIINIFTGGINVLPTSSPSCVKYFHGLLDYKIVGRTKKGGPSLDEKNLWKLKVKNPNNAMINICLEYRRLKKETGMLRFKQWNRHNLLAMMPENEETTNI